MNFLLIIFLGALGVLLRYLCVQYVPVGLIAWPVLAVNIIGSFVAGWFLNPKVLTFFSESPWVSAITIGLLGGFTTFSAFSADTVRLLIESQWFAAGLCIFLNNAFSIGFCFLGFRLATFWN